MAAINSGADAVYIGAARFGAREAAGNQYSDIQALVRYAHRCWARVYVTVNTLLYDHELEPAGKLIGELYELGVDAIIIQDMGLLELDLPPLPLFASTQMHNHTPERIAFLEKVGIRRVILARELSLEQISRIRQSTSLELESFIHGALCVSYSGQCYMSYALGGRSGNRGQCAQPCRKRYALQNASGKLLAQGRHLLSLRDLNLSGGLGDLLEAGIRSFKIEGRLKDRAYVTNVVSHYRQELDALLEGRGLRRSSSGRSFAGFSPNLDKTFNRGYTRYFLRGRGEALTAWETPKATGELVGRVVSLGAGFFSLDQEVQLAPGDGLCFFDGQELRGTRVRRLEGKAVYPEKLEGLRTGLAVYRNHDRLFLAALEKSQPRRKIGVHFTLGEAPGGLRLEALDEDGVQAFQTLDCSLEPAEKPQQARLALEKQLGKLGGTLFELRSLQLDLPQIPFVPVAALNELRRQAVERLETAREAARPREQGGILKNAAPFPETELTFRGNVLNHKAEAFYRRHGVTGIEPAAESGLDLHGQVVMTTRYCLRYELDACPLKEKRGRLEEPLRLVDEEGHVFRLRFDCKRCVMEVILEPGA